ncbi:hypothetical protein ACHAPE_009033 [Trichoderma viride]
MGFKISSALVGFAYLASIVAADTIVVNLFSDTTCQNYVTSFTIQQEGVDTFNYNYEYSTAHSFGIVYCYTAPTDGTCDVFNNNSGGHSHAEGEGSEGNCVSYNGATQTSWNIYSNAYDPGNNGE